MNKTTQLFAGALLGVALLIGLGAATYHNDAISTVDLTVTGNLIFGGQTNTSFPAGGIAGTLVNTNGATTAGWFPVMTDTSGTNTVPTNALPNTVMIDGQPLTAVLTNKALGSALLGPPTTGLLARYSADTLSGSDGTIITNWPDLSGNGYTATGTNGGSYIGPKLYNNVVAGHKAARFIGSEEVTPENNKINFPSGLNVNAASVSVFFITRRFCGADSAIVNFGAPGYTLNLQYRNSQADQEYWNAICDGKIFTLATTHPRVPSTVCLHGFTMQTNALAANSIQPTHWINSSCWQASPNQTTNQTFSGGFMGGMGIDSYAYSGDIFECLVYDHPLKDSEIQQLQLWAYSTYPIHAKASVQVWCFGDSIIGGGGSIPGSRLNDVLPYDLATYLGDRFETYNFGYGGALLAGITSCFQAVSNQVVNPNFASSIVVVQGGVNDLINNTNSWVAYTNYATLCQLVKKCGADYVIGVTEPRYGTNAAAYNLRITSNLIADSGIDAVVDWQADTRLANAANTNYFQVDLVHPTTAGAALMAKMLAVPIQARTAINSLTRMPKTIVAPGTDGGLQINLPSGRVNFAIGATSLIVTNALVDANTIITATAASADTTGYVTSCVPTAGSFTIYCVAPAAEMAVNWRITN